MTIHILTLKLVQNSLMMIMLIKLQIIFCMMNYLFKNKMKLQLLRNQKLQKLVQLRKQLL
jgi:hypothetical protein